MRGEKSAGSLPIQAKSLVFNQLGETNEVQSFISSPMKRIFTLDVKTHDSLKVKRRTLVITSFEASSNSKSKVEEEDQVSSNHITVQETDDFEVK